MMFLYSTAVRCSTNFVSTEFSFAYQHQSALLPKLDQESLIKRPSQASLAPADAARFLQHNRWFGSVGCHLDQPQPGIYQMSTLIQMLHRRLLLRPVTNRTSNPALRGLWCFIFFSWHLDWACCTSRMMAEHNVQDGLHSWATRFS